MSIGLFCVSVGLFCVSVGLFCVLIESLSMGRGHAPHFQLCGALVGLFYVTIGLFCVFVGLFFCHERITSNSVVRSFDVCIGLFCVLLGPFCVSKDLFCVSIGFFCVLIGSLPTGRGHATHFLNNTQNKTSNFMVRSIGVFIGLFCVLLLLGLFCVSTGLFCVSIGFFLCVDRITSNG